MSIQANLQHAHAKRAEVISALEGLIAKDGPMSDETNAAAEAYQKEIAEWTAKINHGQKLLDDIAQYAKPAIVEPEKLDKPIQHDAPAPALSGARSKENRPPSLNIAKAMFHLVRAHGVSEVAQMTAKAAGDVGAQMILNAAVDPSVTTAAGDSAALVRESWGEFYDMLRPMTIIGRLPGVQRIDFTGISSLKLPYRVSGATGGWVGEAKPIPAGTNVFASGTVVPYKLGVIIASSRELFARSTPAAEVLLRDDMLQQCAKVADTKFVSADAASAGVSPAGITNGVAGAYTYASAGLTVANVTTDLMKARKQFASVDQPGPYVLVCDPTFVEFARALRDANSNFVFKDELDSGRIYGMPYVESTTVTDTQLIIVAAPDIIIGTDADNNRMEVDFSATVQLQDDPTDPIDVTDDGATSVSKIVSAFQSDLALLKVVMGVTWHKRRASAVVLVHTGTWAN